MTLNNLEFVFRILNNLIILFILDFIIIIKLHNLS